MPAVWVWGTRIAAPRRVTLATPCGNLAAQNQQIFFWVAMAIARSVLRRPDRLSHHQTRRAASAWLMHPCAPDMGLAGGSGASPSGSPRAPRTGDHLIEKCVGNVRSAHFCCAPRHPRAGKPTWLDGPLSVWTSSVATPDNAPGTRSYRAGASSISNDMEHDQGQDRNRNRDRNRDRNRHRGRVLQAARAVDAHPGQVLRNARVLVELVGALEDDVDGHGLIHQELQHARALCRAIAGDPGTFSSTLASVALECERRLGSLPPAREEAAHDDSDELARRFAQFPYLSRWGRLDVLRDATADDGGGHARILLPLLASQSISMSCTLASLFPDETNSALALSQVTGRPDVGPAALDALLAHVAHLYGDRRGNLLNVPLQPMLPTPFDDLRTAVRKLATVLELLPRDPRKRHAPTDALVPYLLVGLLDHRRADPRAYRACVLPLLLRIVTRFPYLSGAVHSHVLQTCDDPQLAVELLGSLGQTDAPRVLLDAQEFFMCQALSFMGSLPRHRLQLARYDTLLTLAARDRRVPAHATLAALERFAADPECVSVWRWGTRVLRLARTTLQTHAEPEAQLAARPAALRVLRLARTASRNPDVCDRAGQLERLLLLAAGGAGLGTFERMPMAPEEGNATSPLAQTVIGSSGPRAPAAEALTMQQLPGDWELVMDLYHGGHPTLASLVSGEDTASATYMCVGGGFWQSSRSARDVDAAATRAKVSFSSSSSSSSRTSSSARADDWPRQVLLPLIFLHPRPCLALQLCCPRRGSMLPSNPFTSRTSPANTAFSCPITPVQPVATTFRVRFEATLGLAGTGGKDVDAAFVSLHGHLPDVRVSMQDLALPLPCADPAQQREERFLALWEDMGSEAEAVIPVRGMDSTLALRDLRKRLAPFEVVRRSNANANADTNPKGVARSSDCDDADCPCCCFGLFLPPTRTLSLFCTTKHALAACCASGLAQERYWRVWMLCLFLPVSAYTCLFVPMYVGHAYFVVCKSIFQCGVLLAPFVPLGKSADREAKNQRGTGPHGDPARHAGRTFEAARGGLRQTRRTSARGSVAGRSDTRNGFRQHLADRPVHLLGRAVRLDLPADPRVLVVLDDGARLVHVGAEALLDSFNVVIRAAARLAPLEQACLHDVLGAIKEQAPCHNGLASHDALPAVEVVRISREAVCEETRESKCVVEHALQRRCKLFGSARAR